MRNAQEEFNEMFEPLEEPFDMFSVSNKGYVINVDDEMIVPMQRDENNGRLYVRLTTRNPQGNQVVRVLYIAKLVADMFVRNENCDKFVGFKDGDPLNNRSDNLFFAPNMFTANEPLLRPERLIVEEEKHALMCAIGEALDNGEIEKAQRLGARCWNLENDNSEEQTEYDWL